MSCVLRATGRTFDVERYVARSPLRALSVHRRRSLVFPTTQPAGRRHSHSGCSIEVSGRTFDDFAGQIRDAVRFLKRNHGAVRALRRFPGVESVTLDFGVTWRDVVAQVDTLPEELVVLVGKCRLGLAISHYPVTGALGRRLPTTNRTAKGGRKAPHNNRMQLSKREGGPASRAIVGVALRS